MKVLKKLILPAIIGLAAYLVVMSGQAPQLTGELASAAPLDEPILSLVAPSGAQSPEGIIDVQVEITSSAGLAALEFDLVVDKTLVEVSGITITPLLGKTDNCDPALNRCAFSLGPLPGNDVTSLGGYSYGNGAGTASEGTLATVHLATTGITGTTALSLAKVRLADVNGNLIEPRVNNTSLLLDDSQSRTVYLPMIVNGSGNPDSARTRNGEAASPISGEIESNLSSSIFLNSSNSFMSLVGSFQPADLLGMNPDVNGNGVTDVVDIQLVAACWGMAPTDPGCGDSLDLNRDQAIDAIDVGLVVARWKLGLVGIERFSPPYGQTGVAVTRETVFEFEKPLDPSSVTSSAFAAYYGGQTLTTTLLHSADGRRVTLFYDPPLPPAARVRVIADGDLLMDAEGYVVDANGDGYPGGLGVIDFDTLSLSPVPGTDVWGYVYDSYNTTPGGDDIPVVGATIRVDGLPGLNAVTDSGGYFLLEDVPAPEFFVHIDGSTATSAPAGTQYATVGKAFHSIPGRSTQLIMDGETFDIYLPPMALGDLVSLSPTEETDVGFGTAGKAELEELFPNMDPAVWDQTMVMFPPESAIDNQGNPATEAAIIPVDATRLPAPLPPGINHQLDIAVMAPGASNFDEPAPACFPNLVDPDTGEKPAPGEKAGLMSFNHDTGKWELVGLMTVSEDGQMVCTDPGVGIRAPGWHGVAPSPVGPPPPPNDGPCGAAPAGPAPSTASSPAGQLSLSGATDGVTTYAYKVQDAQEDDGPPPVQCLPPPCQPDPTAFNICVGAAGVTAVGWVAACYAASTACVAGAVAGTAGLGIPACMVLYGTCLATCAAAEAAALIACDRAYNCGGPQPAGLTGAPSTYNATGDDPIVDQIRQILDQVESLSSPYGIGQELPQEIIDQVNDLLTQADTIAGGDAVQYLDDYVLQKEVEVAPLRAEIGEPEGNAPPYPVLYMAEVYRPGGVLRLRGETDPYGQYALFLPRDGELQYVSFYDPLTDSYGQVLPNRRPDAPYRLPALDIFPVDPTFLDSDDDGLANVVEHVIGTDVIKPDTDDDGIPDGAEVQQGTNPLDGLPTATGIIASADTPGTAVDVCAVNDIAVVADSKAGVSLFSIIAGKSPVILAQVDTPGISQRVACPTGSSGGDTQTLIAVADGPAGLALVDVSDPPLASIVEQIALDGDARAVVTAGGVAYVGTSNGIVAAVDMASGSILHQIDVGPTVQELAIEGDTLHILAGFNAGETTLSTHGLLDDDLAQKDSIAGFNASGDSHSSRRRLFVGGGFAYPTSNIGYDVIDVSDPSSLQRQVSASNQGQLSFKQIVANGSGLSVGPVGAFANNDPSSHQLYLYDTSDPNNNSQFLTLFETPGVAYAASIYNGLAYVADGQAGLQVVNYLPYDSQDVPPTITLSTNFSPGLAEESKVMRLSAAVEDDVQVRNVQYYLDGLFLAEDGAFPFEHRFITPLASQQPTMTLQARAVDTGGNLAWTEALTFTLVLDATPPQVYSVTPLDGSKVLSGTVSALSANFSEPLDPLSLGNSSFTLTSAGPDGILDNGDDVPVSGGIVSFREEINTAFLTFSNGLPSGLYRAGLTTGITDIAGNQLATGHSWSFTSPPEVHWDGGGDGSTWIDPLNWRNDQLPQNGDVVFIKDPGDITVNYSTGTTTLFSLESEEAITLSGGTLSIDSASFINKEFRQTGGVLGGAGTLTVAGLMTWTAGTQAGSGETVAAGGLLLEGGSLKDLQSRSLTLDGPSTWTAGQVRFMHGATLTNNSSFDIQTDTDLQHYTGVVSTFINNGTVSKTAGSGTTAIQAHPYNFGTMAVLTGTLSVGTSGVTGSSEGSFLVPPGAALELWGNQTLQATSVVSGGGNVNFRGGGTSEFKGNYGVDLTLSGGTLLVTGNITVTGGFAQPGGILSGAGTMTVQGLMTWTAGTQAGIGETVAAGGLLLEGGSLKDLQSRSLTLDGPSTWTAGQVRFMHGATLTNNSTFDIQTDTDLQHYTGVVSTFINNGIVSKTAGSGMTLIQANPYNFGTMEILTGTLSVGIGNATGNSEGTFDVWAGAKLDLQGSQTMLATSVITGAGSLSNSAGGTTVIQGTYGVGGPLTVSGGTLRFDTGGGVTLSGLALTGGALTVDSPLAVTSTFVQSGGTLNGADTLTVAGLMTWTAGTQAGSGETVAAGGLLLEGGSLKDLQSRSLTLDGPSTWTAGQVRFMHGATLTNNSSFDIQTDTDLQHYTGVVSTFISNGTVSKTAGSGTTAIQAHPYNFGTMEILTGTLSVGMAATGSSEGSFLVTPGAALELWGNQTLQATSEISGGGNVNFRGGGTSEFKGNYGVDLTLSGGTLLVTGNITVTGEFAQPGGVLSGAGTMTVQGLMTWTAGTQAGSGETVAAGGLLLEGGNLKDLQSRSLTLDGPSTWTAGQVRFMHGATLTNNSSFDIQTDTDLQHYTGVVSTFINNGTVSKTAGSGTTLIQVHPYNFGTMEILTGTLSVGIGNGTGSSEGTFDVSAGAKLDLQGSQTMNPTSVITGAGSLSNSAGGTTVIQGTYGVGGPLSVSAGTLRFDTGGSVTLSGLTLTGGVLTVDSPLAVTGTFLQSGGTLNGTDRFTVAGLMTWTAGTQAGSGETVAAGGLLLEGGSLKDLQSRSLTLDGPSTWTAGQVRFMHGATLTNNSTFDIQTDTDLQHYTGIFSTFINNGTVSKTAGSGTTAIQAHPYNFGTMEILTGTLSVGMGGATGSSEGSFLVPPGAALELWGNQTLQATSVVSGGGNVNFRGGGTSEFKGNYGVDLTLSGGTLLVTGNITVTGGFAQPGGILSGAGTMTVQGLMTWTAGTQAGIGETVAAGGLLLEGGSLKDLQSRSLTLDGPSTWTAGQVRFMHGATLTNNSTFDIQTDTDLQHYTGIVSTFINNGTVSKTAGTGTTLIQAHPYNFGTMEILTGTLSVGTSGATGSSEGVFDVTAGSVLELWGNQTLQATSVVSGGGNVNFRGGGTTEFKGSYGVDLTLSGGTLLVTDNITVTGGFDQPGGTLAGAGRLTVQGLMTWTAGTQADIQGGSGETVAAGGLLLEGASLKDLQSRSLTLDGPSTWTAGQIRLWNGGTLTNNSTFDIQTDTDLQHYTGVVSTFNNNGTVNKTAGSAATDIGANVVTGGAFGVSSGQITFGQTFLQNSSGNLEVDIGSLTPVVGFDKYTIALAATLDGTLSISLVDSYIPTEGDTFEIMTFASRSGTFTSEQGLDIGNGTHFEVTYGATNVVLEVVADGPG